MMLFDFFKKDKEYVSCEWLEYGIQMGAIGIFHCCQFSLSDENNMPVSFLTKDNKYNFKDFLKKKKQAKKLHRKGIINSRCKGCFDLKKAQWSEKFEIRKMAIGPNTKCNSDCIYCYTHRNKKFYNTKPDIPIYDFLKQAVETKLISTECEIAFNNGEPLLMDRFEDIMNLFIDNNIRKVIVHSSGITYSPAVERALKTGHCELIISPDASNRELYKKIKNVDKFDEVWANIVKYAQNENVRIKYILIPEINTKAEQIDEFLEKLHQTPVKDILIDIELNWFKFHKNNKEKMFKVLNLAKYMENKALKSGLRVVHAIFLNTAIFENKEMYDSINV